MNFDIYKNRLETELRSFIERMGEKEPLRDACSYALMNGGKRFRPSLVLMTAEAIGNCDVMPSAMSVEFFHTASLIVDDLPCMDNDAMRRGVPSLHKVVGEAAAILAGLTLIAAGYGGIYENATIMRIYPQFARTSDQRAIECLKSATSCAGIQGATQGQFLDLFPPDSKIETIREIIYKKTVTLFEISFFFGWLFGGGDFSALPLLKACAYHLGMAFQIADDLEDDSQDSTHARGVNIATLLGKEKAISCFEEEIALLEKSLKKVDLWTAPFQGLLSSLAGRQRLFASRSLLGRSATSG
jgi:geranylgeranyl diphosphate synthase type II